MNWQDVPRDLIADDDDLEYLYQLANLQKPTPIADPPKVWDNRVPQLERFKKRKKPSNTDSGLGKIACIALLALLLPVMLSAGGVHAL